MQNRPNSLKLEDVIVPATFPINPKQSISKLRDEIIKEFNKGVTSVVSESYYRGKRIKADEVMMVRRNGVQELAAMKEYNLALPLFNMLDDIAEMSTGKITATYYGGNGYEKHVVNVPAGKYFRAWSNTQPLLLGPGTHVIKDIGFRTDKPKVEENFVNQSEPYINHGIISILRVPGGSLAEVKFGTVPDLLASQQEPYVYMDPLFVFVPKRDTLFWDANNALIVSGSLKRVLPKTGTAFVSYNNGKLQIINTQDDGPTIITSDGHAVNPEPVSIGLTNFSIPSAAAKKRLKDGNPTVAQEQLDYITAMTQDNLQVGIQIFLTYQITDLREALLALNTTDELIKHIESRTVSIMCGIIQTTASSSLFATTHYQAQDNLESKHESEEPKPEYTASEDSSSGKTVATFVSRPPASAPSYLSVLQSAQHSLAEDLGKIGVKVLSITLEEFKALDKEIATKMSQQAIEMATINGQLARQHVETDVEQTKAKREASVSEIKQVQANANIISAARSEAEALGVRTQAQIDSETRLSEFYANHPTMLALRQMQIKADTLKGSHLFVSNTEITGITQGGANFFTQSKQGGLTHKSDAPRIGEDNSSTATTPSMTIGG